MLFRIMAIHKNQRHIRKVFRDLFFPSQSLPPPKNYQPSSSQSNEPFIAEDVNGLQTGMEVMHEKFGEGKVVSIEGAGVNKIASIHFGGYGIKKIMLKFAKLKIITANM